MSLLANIAAGALGGAGDSLSNIGRNQAKAEIEEAKELRARAFQKEMYEQQRFDNRIDTAAANETTRARDELRYSQDRFGQLENMKREDDQLGITNKLNQDKFALLEEEQKMKREKFDVEIKNLKNASQTESTKIARELLKEVNSDLDKVNGRIASLYKESGGMEISPEIASEIAGLTELRETYLSQKEALDANITDPLVRDYMNKQNEAKIAEYASAVGIDPEKYKQLSKANPKDADKEELAKRFLRKDKEAEIFMAVQSRENPVLWNEINSLKNKYTTSLDAQARDSERPEQGLLKESPVPSTARRERPVAPENTEQEIKDLEQRRLDATRNGDREAVQRYSKMIIDLQSKIQKGLF